MLNPQSIRDSNSYYFSLLDREIQDFLFMFLPNLFHDVADKIDTGFTCEQVRAINNYFDKMITLVAIVYPHKSFLFFGNSNYKLIQQLHAYFNKLVKVCENATTSKSKKQKLYSRMRDSFAKLVRRFQSINGFSLDDKKQRLLQNVIRNMNDVVQEEMGNIGLNAIDRFLEARRKENLPLLEIEQNNYENVTEQTEDTTTEDKNNNLSHVEFINILTDFLCELDNFSPSDPKPETGLDRYDIRRALHRIIGVDDAVILDLGCGSGPLMQALDLLDLKQLKTLSYIGINYNNVEEAFAFAEKKDLFSKLKSCQLETFENFEFNNLQADFIFMIDILHHLCPAELDIMIKTAITHLKKNKKIIIIESVKHRELDKFHWTPNDIRNLLQNYSTLKVYAHNETDYIKGDETPVTIASIEKINDVVIGPEFKDTCLALFNEKLGEIDKKIEAIDNSDKENYEKLSEKAPLYLVQRSILKCMHESKKLWS